MCKLLILYHSCKIICHSGKLLRASKYEEEISDGHLGINEKELNSMNKHIPGTIEILCAEVLTNSLFSIEGI